MRDYKPLQSRIPSAMIAIARRCNARHCPNAHSPGPDIQCQPASEACKPPAPAWPQYPAGPVHLQPGTPMGDKAHPPHQPAKDDNCCHRCHAEQCAYDQRLESAEKANQCATIAGNIGGHTHENSPESTSPSARSARTPMTSANVAAMEIWSIARSYTRPFATPGPTTNAQTSCAARLLKWC